MTPHPGPTSPQHYEYGDTEEENESEEEQKRFEINLSKSEKELQEIREVISQEKEDKTHDKENEVSFQVCFLDDSSTKHHLELTLDKRLLQIASPDMLKEIQTKEPLDLRYFGNQRQIELFSSWLTSGDQAIEQVYTETSMTDPDDANDLFAPLFILAFRLNSVLFKRSIVGIADFEECFEKFLGIVSAVLEAKNLDNSTKDYFLSFLAWELEPKITSEEWNDYFTDEIWNEVGKIIEKELRKAKDEKIKKREKKAAEERAKKLEAWRAKSDEEKAMLRRAWTTGKAMINHQPSQYSRKFVEDYLSDYWLYMSDVS